MEPPVKDEQSLVIETPISNYMGSVESILLQFKVNRI